MRLVSLLAILMIAASCGKDGGSSGGSSGKSGSRACDLNGRAVACESIQGADGQGVDLLESVIDVPVKIENADITFLADKSAQATGRRINCTTSVKNGEVYRFALRGDKLLVMTGSGSYEMTRLSDGDGIGGAWVWKGYVDQGTHVIKNMSILGNSRIVLRTQCEL